MHDVLTDEAMINWLETRDEALLASLYARAYAVKLEQVGNKVYYRGIIEFSNICEKDCFYCGIRRSNGAVKRYTVEDADVLAAARWAWEQKYGSIVLQSGERQNAAFVDRIEALLNQIREATNGELGVTLSLGEQTRETFERWRAAGAKRYLLRIETANPVLYRSLHPDDHRHDVRLQCLQDLRELDYQVGTGVMIGLPGQTPRDLVNDIRFFRDHDIDMIGMGPFIPHSQTPLAGEAATFDKRRQLQLGLTMIALTRIALKDVNIAATTALQALDPKGREQGLAAGANIIMPNLTDTKYREGYQLYDGKPCLDENAGMCRFCLEGRITSIGEQVGYGEQGDSPHYLRRRSGFDISRVPFSTHGSWMSISIPAGKTEIFFRNHHFKSHDLFTFQTFMDGRLATPVIRTNASVLVLEAGAGRVEICFEGPDSVRLRGHGGVALRLACKRNHAYSNGPGMAVFNFRKAYRRYQFESLRGSLALKGAYASEAEDLNNLAEIMGDGVLKSAEDGMQVIIMSPDADGGWELAIDEFWSSWKRPERKGFDACLAASAEAFKTFLKGFFPVRADLAEARALAAYIDWSCTVNPAGLIKRPTLFMSKNWMDNVWSWDQCFNAMALAAGHPQLALDQMLTEVDHQDAFGAYPDAFNDLEIHYNFSKPPVHGLAFAEILRRLPAPPSREVMETMVASLGKQADWWMTYRLTRPASIAPASGIGHRASSSLAGLPYYLHGNDSGWDNSTMFARGVPLVAPDLSALLVLQMDVLARLSADLGRPEAASVWARRADALFEGLMRELWCGDHFVARLANDGTAVESMSLIPWLPLVLGERLPETVRACLRRGIERHLTEWGLATERVDSPDYSEDGYWRGPIWAPSTFLAVTGLERSGHGDLADVIADRFCNLCAKSGFAENYNAITGAPLCDPAYTWTASVFLLLASRNA